MFRVQKPTEKGRLLSKLFDLMIDILQSGKAHNCKIGYFVIWTGKSIKVY